MVMKRISIQLVVVTLVLALTGSGLAPMQQRLTSSLRQDGFIPQSLDGEQERQLGQTGAAIVLGGLRSIVASFLNLQALGEFEKRDWVELERIYEMIVTLEPRNAYYWEAGAWHLGTNAYYDYEHKLGMSEARAQQKQDEYQRKGEQFLLRGTEQLPDEVELWKALGRLYSDPHRPYDFEQAAHYFQRATECSRAKDRMRREYFYTLSRVEGMELEAWKLGNQLYFSGNNQQFSSMKSLMYVLSLYKNPALAADDRLLEAFYGDNKKRAYKDLVNYWLRSRRERFPRGYLQAVILRLAEELQVEDAQNPLKNPQMKRIRTRDF